METIILNLLNYPNALEEISKSIVKQFSTKGNDIVEANQKAITSSLEKLVLVETKSSSLVNKCPFVLT